MPNNRNNVPSFSVLAKEKEKKSNPKPSPGPSSARFAVSPKHLSTLAETQIAEKTTLFLPDGPVVQTSGHLICIFQWKKVWSWPKRRNGPRHHNRSFDHSRTDLVISKENIESINENEDDPHLLQL